MTTIQQNWEMYRARVYPKDMPAAQLKELHQTFFSGALVMFLATVEATCLPEDESVKALSKLSGEVHDTLEARAQQFRSRN